MYWEPGELLQVGDVVRVRLNGECRGWWADDSDPIHPAPFPHDELFNGLVSRVDYIVQEATDGHRFALARPCAPGEWCRDFDLYARLELVRLAEPPPARS